MNRENDWGWLHKSVWFRSSESIDKENSSSWLSGKILEISQILPSASNPTSSDENSTGNSTNENNMDGIWKILIQLDKTQYLSPEYISLTPQVMTVNIKGSYNHQHHELQFQNIFYRLNSLQLYENSFDLSQLQYINEPEILTILKLRYNMEQPFQFIGPILLAINPFHKIELYSDNYLQKYIQYGELRNLSLLPPHIYKIADTAYHHMLLDLFEPEKRENQTIVITGDSGAGKTECSKYLLHYFSQLSRDALPWMGSTDSETHNENTIEDLVLASNAITESLGNAKTVHNDNSSRFGKYIELYYSAKGHLEGVGIRTYLLEATRVTHHSSDERNFHIFYQLYAGFDQVERTKFGFESLSSFHYLHFNSADSTDQDLTKYQQLINSFNRFNISYETRLELFKVFIGVLHTGNIEFIESTDGETCDFSSNDQVTFHLQKSCELMGYTVEALRDIFCNKKIASRGKDVIMGNSITNALAMRDRLARTLYYSLFKWILTEINFVLGQNTSRNARSWIGILDIFGFENIEKNNLEQLCINYTHEKLKNYYHFMIFEMEQILYAQEGLRQRNRFAPKYLENSLQIDFFENPVSGLFVLLNEHMKQNDATDNKFLQLLKHKNEINSCFQCSEEDIRQNIFIIHHYTIPVIYHVENILERNKGIREINFTTLPSTSNQFYSTDNSQQDMIPSSSSTTTATTTTTTTATTTTIPTLPVLQTSDSTILEKSISLSGDALKSSVSVQTLIKNKSKTICSVYYTEVCDLILKLQGTKSHFIICFKPNNTKNQAFYDISVMKQQIQSYSILETCLVTSNYISRQLTFPIFFYKYRVLLYPLGYCSLTKSIFQFLHSTKYENRTDDAYRSTVISFIDILPITQLILQQIYPKEKFPSLPNFENFSNFLKVGQSNVFLIGNIFDLLERLYYLTTDFIARKLQRIWKISKSHYYPTTTPTTSTPTGTGTSTPGSRRRISVQTAVLKSLRYFNHFRFRKSRDYIISTILIQRKFRQYLDRRRYLTSSRIVRTSSPPSRHHHDIRLIIKCQSLIRGWLCRKNLQKSKPKARDNTRRDQTTRNIVTADDFFPLVEGNSFIKVCRNRKTHKTNVMLTFDRRYIQWQPDKLSFKSPKLCLMDLADVVTLQRGITAPRFQLATQLVNQPDLPERSFSLITADGRSLDLIASSINIAEEWFKCLNFLIFDIYTIREDLYKVWCLIVTGEGIKEEVDDLDILDEIIDDSIKEDLISIRNFALYWNTIQDPRFPPHHILQDIDKCLPGLRVTCEYFTFQAFFCLISSFENNAFDPCRLQVYQEMTHPLSHYFINSSDHINVISKAISSEDYLFSYQTDLVNGCRAIELHCWDGINSPIVSSYVRHCNDPLSSTSTVEVSLEKVLEVIQKYAFVTSPYPLFLFIENHCSLHIQEMIAYYLLATFGDKIVPANEISYGSDDFGRYLPSPNDLYEKVIVVISDTRHNYKTPLEEDMLDKKSLRPISSQLLSYGEDEIKSEINHQRDSLPQVQSTSTMGMGEVKVENRSIRSNSNTESFYHPHFRELATMMSRNVLDITTMQGLNLHHLLSFSEIDMLSYLSHKEALQLLRINTNHLSRVYSDDRLENCHLLDPIRAWCVGSSMVFVDYHNPPESESDISAMVAKQKFLDNGGCGYVLKPPYAINNGTPFPPSSLCVHLLSGQWLPDLSDEIQDGDDINPRVTVEIRGLPQDNQKFTTETTGGPGRLDNPIWDEVFHLDIEAPDAAYLIFILTIGTRIIGSSALPISCLRVGFRVVELYSNGKKLLNTTLTIRTSLSKLNNIQAKVFYDSPELLKYDEVRMNEEFKFH